LAEVSQLARLVRSARRAVVLTGAGISTESGIPDFRSPNGIWATNTPVLYQDFMASRDARVRAWKLASAMFRECSAARANDGHLALAELERRGHLAAVVTQNIDRLHQQAGSQNVIELHGHNRAAACQRCGAEWPTEQVLARVAAGEDAPQCSICDGPLKTKTISFGQAMPQEEMAAAVAASQAADLFIAIGSSLVVEPANHLPRFAHRRNAALVIINRDPTPLDDLASLILRTPIGATMRGLFVELGYALPAAAVTPINEH
jgi:NAD-dependent deacetylase